MGRKHTSRDDTCFGMTLLEKTPPGMSEKAVPHKKDSLRNDTVTLVMTFSGHDIFRNDTVYDDVLADITV